MQQIGDTMSEQTNEMALSVVSAPAMGVVGGDVGISLPSPSPEMNSIAIGSPSREHDPKNITVYSNSITPVSYQSADEVAAFDVVFSVGIMCEDGSSKTYQVVKRIGIDKCKIACEAECSTPVSIVESKRAAIAEAAATKSRFRKLAGLE